MRNYMPAEHRALIAAVEAMPSIRAMASKQNYNAVLDAMAEFRSVHYGWAQEYINRWTDDPRGTGGTPYMQWLKQLIDETLAFEEPATPADADRLVAQARDLLAPSENGSAFARSYFEAIQRDPNVVLAHRDMLRVFTALV